MPSIAQAPWAPGLAADHFSRTVCWSKLLCFVDCFVDDAELTRCEIDTFRYKILHMAARITRSGRVGAARLDRTWFWAKALALGFERLRATFASDAHSVPASRADVVRQLLADS
jgi:hypothetical protein